MKVFNALGHWHQSPGTLQPSWCKSEPAWLPEKCFPCEHSVLADQGFGSVSVEPEGWTDPGCASLFLHERGNQSWGCSV